MVFLDYVSWQKFNNVIQIAIENVETVVDDASNHFIQQVNMVNRSHPGGRNMSDYKLSRLAAYHTSLCCDSRGNDTVKAAKHYFAVKTYVAETTLIEQIPLPHKSQVSEFKEKAEISPHLIRVWIALCDSGVWITNAELAAKTGIAARTARSHTKYLFALGLLDKLEVFPCHRFRLSATAAKQNAAAYQRLEEIRQVFSNRFQLK